MNVTNVSRAFWRGDTNKEPLQRVYGITFPDTKQLKEYEHRIAEVGEGVRWVRVKDRGFWPGLG